MFVRSSLIPLAAGILFTQYVSGESSDDLQSYDLPLHYTDQNVTSNINGTQVLFGDRGDNDYIPLSKAFQKIALFNDDSYEEKIKSGEISTITFSQDDVNALAQAIPNGKYQYYADFPLPASGDSLPPLLPDIIASPPSCCEPPSDLALPAAGSNVVTNISVNLHTRNFIDFSNPLNMLKDIGESHDNGSLYVPYIPYTHVPIFPSFSYFYNQLPITYINRPNGYPLSYRQVNVNTQYYGNGTRAYQVAFRTQDSLGKANQDVMSVVIPGHNDDQHFVVYQNHEDGRSINCAESFNIATGQIDADIFLFTSNNWTVIIPDYEGAKAVYGANIREAYSVLNSIRAFLNVKSAFNVRNNHGFMFGYSAGATITGKAVELMPAYSPEIISNMLGAAIGGFVNNMTQAFIQVNQGRYAGFVPMQLGALAQEYPDFKEVLKKSVKPWQWWKFATTMTCAFVLNIFVGTNMNDLTWEGDRFIYNPVLQRILKEVSAGVSAPAVPMYIFQSTADMSANTYTVDDAVNVYCREGGRVWYLRDNNNLGHLQEEALRTGTVVPYFKGLIEGRVPGYCSNWQSAIISQPPI